MDSNFAKSQLIKYGWIEGKGLGKHEDGITQPVKQKLKFDTAGVGHKFEDTCNWWENNFNTAANRITVNTDTDGASISISNESTKDDLNVKESKDSLNYGNFVKTSTLLNGNLITEDSYVNKEQNIEGNLAFNISDEELFKACGGRTAHKGARHGLTLNGKLKRLEQQEKDLLNLNPRLIRLERLQNSNVFQDEEEIDNENTTLPIVPTDGASYLNVSKKTKKKDKRRINDLSHKLRISCKLNDSDTKDISTVKEEKEEMEQDKKKERKLKYDHKYKCIEACNEAYDAFDAFVSYWQEHIKKQGTEQLRCPQTKKLKKSRKNKSDTDFYLKKKTDCSNNRIKKKKLKKLHKTEITKLNKIAAEGEIPKESDEIRNSTDKSCTELTDSYLKKKTDWLNNRIKKKKRTKLRKKKRPTLEKITAALENVHINTKKLKEDSNEKSKEKKKKKKNI